MYLMSDNQATAPCGAGGCPICIPAVEIGKVDLGCGVARSWRVHENRCNDHEQRQGESGYVFSGAVPMANVA